AVPDHHRRGGAPVRGSGIRGGGGHPGRETDDRFPAGHRPAGCPLPGGGRGPVLGPGPGRVRRDDHLRRQLPWPDRDHAHRRVLRAGDRSRRRDRAQPGAAGGLRHRAGLPARPLAAGRLTLMTRGEGDGLVFDAEVRRGGFTLAVSLTAACGEVLGLLGPNGAGKSTLLGAVAGLTPVSAGRITLAGQVLDDADAGAFVEASGRPVGFVFQNYRLFPYLTVAENVAFSPRARGQGRQAARSAASHWLDRLGLADLAGPKPGPLCRGGGRAGGAGGG